MLKQTFKYNKLIYTNTKIYKNKQKNTKTSIQMQTKTNTTAKHIQNNGNVSSNDTSSQDQTNPLGRGK